MSWAQRDKTFQETVTFTDKKKIAYNNSDRERFEPRSHFKSRSSLIAWVNVALNRTVVVDSA